MKKLLAVLTAAGFATALTPAVAENASDIWAPQTETSQVSAGQTAQPRQEATNAQSALQKLLEPNGPLAQ
jgi:hypothetical protein